MSSLESFDRDYAMTQLAHELPALSLDEAIARASSVLSTKPPYHCYVNGLLSDALEVLIERVWLRPPSDAGIRLTALCLSYGGAGGRLMGGIVDNMWVHMLGRVIDSQHVQALCILVGLMCEDEHVNLHSLFTAAAFAWPIDQAQVEEEGELAHYPLIPIRHSLAEARRQTLVAVFAGLSREHRFRLLKTLCTGVDGYRMDQWALGEWLKPGEALQFVEQTIASQSGAPGVDRLVFTQEHVALFELIEKDDPNVVLPEAVRVELGKKHPAHWWELRRKETVLEGASRSPALAAFLARKQGEAGRTTTHRTKYNHGDLAESLQRMARVSDAFVDALHNAPFGVSGRTISRDAARHANQFRSRQDDDVEKDFAEMEWH